MSTTASRQYNFVTDKNAAVPITASRVDAELDNIITKLNQKVLVSATAPDSPIAGQLWLDSTNKILKEYRNSEWVTHAPVHVGTSAPATVAEGDLWYDTTNNLLKSYNGSAWGFHLTDPVNTSGNMFYVSSDNVVGTIPAGTANQYLKSNGVATAPSWATFLITGTMVDTDAITTTKLKTATVEVSTASDADKILTGAGSYGFYPQLKQTGSDAWNAYINTAAPGTAYVTKIGFASIESDTAYAQMRYVTTSGQDLWLFILLDRNTGNIIAASSAPDHPAYGNGGNFDAIPHPFPEYDETKHQIILLDKETCKQIVGESKETNKSILTLVNEEYKPDLDKEEKYKPLHSGQFLNSEPVMVERIPDYIKVHKLKRMTDAEKQAKIDARILKKQQIQAQKALVKTNVMAKLNLTETEFAELKQALK